MRTGHLVVGVPLESMSRVKNEPYGFSVDNPTEIMVA